MSMRVLLMVLMLVTGPAFANGGPIEFPATINSWEERVYTCFQSSLIVAETDADKDQPNRVERHQVDGEDIVVLTYVRGYGGDIVSLQVLQPDGSLFTRADPPEEMIKTMIETAFSDHGAATDEQFDRCRAGLRNMSQYR